MLGGSLDFLNCFCVFRLCLLYCVCCMSGGLVVHVCDMFGMVLCCLNACGILFNVAVLLMVLERVVLVVNIVCCAV